MSFIRKIRKLFKRRSNKTLSNIMKARKKILRLDAFNNRKVLTDRVFMRGKQYNHGIRERDMLKGRSITMTYYIL